MAKTKNNTEENYFDDINGEHLETIIDLLL